MSVSLPTPMITDGEQRKYHNAWTYSMNALPTAPRTTSRDTAFAKIRASIEGARLASVALGLG